MSAVAENQIKQLYDAMFHGGDDCGTIPPGKPTNSIVNKLDYLIERAKAGGAATSVDHTHTIDLVLSADLTGRAVGSTGPAQPLDPTP